MMVVMMRMMMMMKMMMMMRIMLMMVKNTNLKSMAEWQEERMTSTFFVLSSICCSTQTDLSPDCGYDDLDDDDYGNISCTCQQVMKYAN